jgi:predicted Fe-Mo cluster-binding NifX family protein
MERALVTSMVSMRCRTTVTISILGINDAFTPGRRENAMKAAIPIWNGRVSPVFDTAGRIMVVTPGSGEGSREIHEIRTGGPGARVSSLRELGASVLICGAISNRMARHVEAAGIRLIPWISGDIEDVLEAFVSGRLSGERFMMPGCGGRGRRRRRRERRPRGYGKE